MDVSQIKTLLIAVFGLAVLAAAIGLAAKAGKADYAHVARVFFTVVGAITIVAMGMGAVAYPDFGGKILALFGFGK